MVWRTISRPGQSGGKKKQLKEMYDNTYGPENWRIMWQWGDDVIDNIFAYQIYEDGYYHDSLKREDLWKELISTASDVYDIEERDIESGLDYLVQNGKATHLQDIAIRRVLFRRGWKFEGDELIKIRSHSQYWGKQLSPGRILFHRPELIIKPSLKSWWNEDSIEDWYQSNKIMQIYE